MKKLTKKEKRERLIQISEVLTELYPEAECALKWGGEDPWRLLVMGRLSAQCTDARVNLTCIDLFARYPNAAAMAEAELEELEEAVRPCGLYRRKASDLREASRLLLDEYKGELPREMDALLGFPGVGRKIANLLRGDIWHLPAVVTDTHCIRICGRFGIYPEAEKSPVKVERILVELLPPECSSDFCHRIVLFGREYCRAISPRCAACPIGKAGLCAHIAEKSAEGSRA